MEIGISPLTILEMWSSSSWLTKVRFDVFGLNSPFKYICIRSRSYKNSWGCFLSIPFLKVVKEHLVLLQCCNNLPFQCVAICVCFGNSKNRLP